MVRYYWLLFMLLFACKSTQQNNAMQVLPFDKQGHRGGRGLMPENTIPAMLNAIELGVTTLETDAVITRDKQVILSHEPFFNHEITTMPNGAFVDEAEEKKLNIYTMSYAETQTYDVGKKQHPRFPLQKKMAATKPLLSNLIDAAENYTNIHGKQSIFYNIETKSNPATDDLYHPSPKEFVDLIIAVIKNKKIEKRVSIQSFDIRTLQYLHQQYPTIRTVLLIEDVDKKKFEEQITQLGFVPNVYSPHYSLVTPQLVSACHQKKVSIIPWTVNDQETILQLKAMGVDGIISDFPNLFADL